MPDPGPSTPATTADPAATDERTAGQRTLGRLAEAVHGVGYYTREMADLSQYGYRGWWHAYFAYRPAPMGAVGAATVVATFYNFAPRMVARAVPGVWDLLSPADTVAMRTERVERGMHRIFDPAGAGPAADGAGRAVALLQRALDGLSGAGRPLFAAHAALGWPADPLTALWHGATLLRELRGDGHNVALAAAGVDGVCAHILMAGRGHGNRATIQSIRGWNDDEWDDGIRRLAERGWVAPDGSLTPAGRQARAGIEAHTDALSAEPVARLGVDLSELLGLLSPLADHLTATGEVAASWPPRHLMKE